MTADENDIVCVARGSLSQVQLWHDLLRAAGIESRVVGDNLTAGLGTALPGSVELWIRSADAEAAGAALARAGGHSWREPESRSIPLTAIPRPTPSRTAPADPGTAHRLTALSRPDRAATRSSARRAGAARAGLRRLDERAPDPAPHRTGLPERTPPIGRSMSDHLRQSRW